MLKLKYNIQQNIIFPGKKKEEHCGEIWQPPLSRALGLDKKTCAVVEGRLEYHRDGIKIKQSLTDWRKPAYKALYLFYIPF